MHLDYTSLKHMIMDLLLCPSDYVYRTVTSKLNISTSVSYENRTRLIEEINRWTLTRMTLQREGRKDD